jgi:hypothetical protein
VPVSFEVVAVVVKLFPAPFKSYLNAVNVPLIFEIASEEIVTVPYGATPFVIKRAEIPP